ncbi:MAG: hypothetical protein GY943_32545 [Chloroflexi bacterium]|nr:hypothetical protein [Chloroflexota bacterium]
MLPGIAGNAGFAGTAAGGVWTPADITTLLWWDYSDLTTLWTTSGRTTNVASDADPIGYVDDKSGNGADGVQGISARREVYQASTQASIRDGTQYQGCVNVDDWSTHTDVSIWMAFNSTTVSGLTIVASESNTGGADYCGAAQNGSSSFTYSNAGSPTNYVDGTRIATPYKRDELWDATHGVGGNQYIEVRNVDLTTWASGISFGTYNANNLLGTIHQCIVVATSVIETGSNRSNMETWMAGQF